MEKKKAIISILILAMIITTFGIGSTILALEKAPDASVSRIDNADSNRSASAKSKTTSKKVTIKFSKSEVIVTKGKTAQLKTSASNKGKVTYTSNDKSIVTVNSSTGKVTTKNNGRVLVTATLNSNKKIKATCCIVVITPYNSKKNQLMVMRNMLMGKFMFIIVLMHITADLGMRLSGLIYLINVQLVTNIILKRMVNQ